MINIQSIWFIPIGLIGQIGIVMGEDERTGKRKAYIGIGYGLSEQRDEQRIIQTGARFPAEMFERIATWLNEEPVKKESDSE